MEGRRAASKLFRAQHGHDEVDEARERDERNDDGFHGGRVGLDARDSADFFAEAGVSGREEEERHGDGDEDEVVHDASSIATIAAAT